MDQERNQSMFFRTRYFGRLEQKNLEIWTVLRFDYLFVLRGFQPFPQLLGMLGTLTGTYVVMHRKGRTEFLLFQHPRTSLIYWLYWFPVASGRTKSPILGCSIVLIKKLAAETHSLFLKLFHSYYIFACGIISD